MMTDQMDMMTDADTDQQADEVYNQILGEVGMAENQNMAVGTGELTQPQAASAQAQTSAAD